MSDLQEKKKTRHILKHTLFLRALSWLYRPTVSSTQQIVSQLLLGYPAACACECDVLNRLHVLCGNATLRPNHFGEVAGTDLSSTKAPCDCANAVGLKVDPCFKHKSWSQM